MVQVNTSRTIGRGRDGTVLFLFGGKKMETRRDGKTCFDDEFVMPSRHVPPLPPIPPRQYTVLILQRVYASLIVNTRYFVMATQGAHVGQTDHLNIDHLDHLDPDLPF